MRTLPRTQKRSNLPPEWRNSPVLRSRKGPIGRIVVHRYTGVMKNSAARTVAQFEKNLGKDKGVIAELLEASGPLNAQERALVDALRQSEKESSSLARLIAETRSEPAQVIKKASQGALLLGQSAAYIQMGLAMPRVVRELRRHLEPKAEVCQACQGKGMVPRTPSEAKETKVCPVCKGEKGLLTTSDHMEFAIEKLIEMSKMGKQPVPLTQVQVQQNQVGGGAQASLMSGFLEKVVTLNSGLLFEKVPERQALPAGPESEPLEAELVLPEGD